LHIHYAQDQTSFILHAVKVLHATTFRRAASIMRDRCNVLNQVHFQASCLQGTDSRFTSSSWTLYHHFDDLHTMLHCSSSSGFSRHLCGIRSALTRSLEAQVTRACP